MQNDGENASYGRDKVFSNYYQGLRIGITSNQNIFQRVK